jgi:hypothetical protein
MQREIQCHDGRGMIPNVMCGLATFTVAAKHSKLFRRGAVSRSEGKAIATDVVPVLGSIGTNVQLLPRAYVQPERLYRD